MRRLALAFAIAATLAGCGGASAESRDTTVVRTVVHVVRGDDRERLPVAPERERAEAAAAALEQTLGHPLEIEVDAALTPASNGALDEQAASSLEALARFFAESAKSDPLRHAFVRASVQRIVARYRAAEEHGAATFDDATHALVFTMREARATWLPGAYELDGALDDAFARELARRYATRREADVPASENEAYFRWLRTRRSDRAKSEPDDERSARLEATVRFEARVRGQAMHDDVERALADGLPFALDAKNASPARARLRAAYARWIDERFFVMPSRVRYAIYDRLFRTRDACAEDPCAGFPELDRTRLALAFFERPAPADEREFQAFDDALCPYEERDGKLDRNRSCTSVFPFLLANAARADRLVAMLARTKRRDFFLAALANAGPRMPALLAALERARGSLYADALRALVDLDHWRFRDQRSMLRDEALRLWPTRPDLRPVLLRVLVEDYAQSGRSDEAYARLGAELGPLDAALFARYLDEGPRAVELAPAMWPALRGVSTPFEIVAARLDGYVAKRGLEAAKTVSGLVRRACEAKDYEGLRVVRVVLEKRVKAGDKDAIALALAARDCRSSSSP